MDNSDKQAFATTFYAMGEFYDKKVSTELLSMYFDDLLELTIEEVKHGAKAHRQDPKHGTFFPRSKSFKCCNSLFVFNLQPTVSAIST